MSKTLNDEWDDFMNNMNMYNIPTCLNDMVHNPVVPEPNLSSSSSPTKKRKNKLRNVENEMIDLDIDLNFNLHLELDPGKEQQLTNNYSSSESTKCLNSLDSTEVLDSIKTLDSASALGSASALDSAVVLGSTEVLDSVPEASPIYISTKTKITFLNRPIPLFDVFWKIPILDYHLFQNGIIKKMMLFKSDSKESLDKLQQIIYENPHPHMEIQCLQHVEGESVTTGYKSKKKFGKQIPQNESEIVAKYQFKDEHKISIGMYSKDIIPTRSKKKSAFDNCFVLIMRIFYEKVFHEVHVKVFNTGKMEIPGIQCDQLFDLVKEEIIHLFAKLMDQDQDQNNELKFLTHLDEIILTNSGFRCNYFIDRVKLFEILKFKYHLDVIFDPCSYPGIQCKFYYNKKLPVGDINQNGIYTEDNGSLDSVCTTGKKLIRLPDYICPVSFMIFRTGSVLIVGKCDIYVLEEIYCFLKQILKTEYHTICQKNGEYVPREKQQKPRKKNIWVFVDDIPKLVEQRNAVLNHLASSSSDDSTDDSKSPSSKKSYIDDAVKRNNTFLAKVYTSNKINDNEEEEEEEAEDVRLF